MRHRKTWLAARDREALRRQRKSPLLRLAGLALLACSLAVPVVEAVAAAQDKPAAAKKTRSANHSNRSKSVKVRHGRHDAGQLLRVSRTDRVSAGDAVAPRIEDYRRSASGIRDERLPASQVDAMQAPAGELSVSSRTVMVFDETSGRSLYSRNDEQSQPIASITKLMTAMVVLDAKLPMDEALTITWDDVDHLRGSSSRVPVGAELTREELLRLALMSSENRAASALGRNYPGGSAAFVRAMNAKAAALGMAQSRFEDSTGLHGGNRASAMDLVRMVQAAREYDKIREFTTTGSHITDVGRKHVEFRNTNALVRSPEWDIGVSKTGYIREAGRCLVMYARIAARPVVIVLLDGDGKYTRIGDAGRIKKWLEARWRSDLLASSS